MLTGGGRLAVVPVREGEAASGGDEALAHAGGSGLLVGSGAESLAESLLEEQVAGELGAIELAGFRPGEWAEVVAPVVAAASVVILPASADGSDLAPRLAGLLGWPLLAGAIRLTANGAAVVRWQGRQIARCEVEGQFVVTILPGSRAVAERPALPGESAGAGAGGGRREVGAEPGPAGASVRAEASAVATTAATARERAPGRVPNEPELIELVASDPAVVDLREAPLILAGGAGLGGAEEFELLAEVARRLGASVGATRVVTDAGVLPNDRQIGTTGISVRPRCYIALGISGAAQHVAGLGSPAHVISVNLDRGCPMMSMADLALVADAPGVLRSLAARLAPAAAEAG